MLLSDVRPVSQDYKQNLETVGLWCPGYRSGGDESPLQHLVKGLNSQSEFQPIPLWPL